MNVCPRTFILKCYFVYFIIYVSDVDTTCNEMNGSTQLLLHFCTSFNLIIIKLTLEYHLCLILIYI
jgi:hypothetical protein